MPEEVSLFLLEDGLEKDMIINICGYDVLISACDAIRILSKKWHIINGQKNVYFSQTYRENSKVKQLKLHRYIVDCPYDMDVDHINCNTLDCRRENLRICTRAENNRNRVKSQKNTSGFKGVRWRKKEKKWVAEISHNNKKIHLGYFDTPERAHEAYTIASEKYHKEFGRIA